MISPGVVPPPLFESHLSIIGCRSLYMHFLTPHVPYSAPRSHFPSPPLPPLHSVWPSLPSPKLSRSLAHSFPTVRDRVSAQLVRFRGGVQRGQGAHRAPRAAPLAVGQTPHDARLVRGEGEGWHARALRRHARPLATTEAHGSNNAQPPPPPLSPSSHPPPPFVVPRSSQDGDCRVKLRSGCIHVLVGRRRALSSA